MKIKYVGMKQDGETAFSDETRITWFPGSVEDVPDAVAERMLKHPDVFAVHDELLTGGQVVEKPAALSLADAKPVATAHDETPSTIQLADGALLPLNGLDNAALHELAKTHSVNVHHNAGAPKVIAALVAAFPVK